MNRFQPRVPNYCDFGPLDPIDFEKFEDLLETDFIKDLLSWPDFLRFTKDTREMMLMAECVTSYWVVGYFKYPESVELPEFDRIAFEEKQNEQKD